MYTRSFLLNLFLLAALAVYGQAQQEPSQIVRYQVEATGDPEMKIFHVSVVVVPVPQPNVPAVFPQELNNALQQVEGVEMVSLMKYAISIRKARVFQWDDVEAKVVEAFRLRWGINVKMEKMPDKPVALPQGFGCYNLIIPNVPQGVLRQLFPQVPGPKAD